MSFSFSGLICHVSLYLNSIVLKPVREIFENHAKPREPINIGHLKHFLVYFTLKVVGLKESQSSKFSYVSEPLQTVASRVEEPFHRISSSFKNYIWIIIACKNSAPEIATKWLAFSLKCTYGRLLEKILYKRKIKEENILSGNGIIAQNDRQVNFNVTVNDKIVCYLSTPYYTTNNSIANVVNEYVRSIYIVRCAHNQGRNKTVLN